LKRSEVRELHNIAPAANVPSIVEHGIHCNHRARGLVRASLASAEIQEIREARFVPNGRKLHEYANLFFDAHNPMLSRIRERNQEVCVIRVSQEVLDLPGVVICPGNAAGAMPRFDPVEGGLEGLEAEAVYAKWFAGALFEAYYPDPVVRAQRMAVKLAEVLVPETVPPKYLLGGIVCNDAVKARLQPHVPAFEITVNGKFFFGDVA
jgi:hypothetical protein